MIDAEEVEDGGVEVADVDGFRWVGDVPAVVIGGTVDAGFDSATSHPERKGAAVVVATGGWSIKGSLGKDGAAEFTAPDDEGVFEKAALFEVGDEGGGGLVGVETLTGELDREGIVLVPSAVE